MKRLETLVRQGRYDLETHAYKRLDRNGVDALDIARAIDRIREGERILRQAYEEKTKPPVTPLAVFPVSPNVYRGMFPAADEAGAVGEAGPPASGSVTPLGDPIPASLTVQGDPDK